MRKTLLIILIISFLLCGCGEKYYEKTIFALHTNMTIKLPQSQKYLFNALIKEIINTNSTFNRFDKNSEIYRINKINKDEIQVSNECVNLLKGIYHYSQITDGAFDITVAPLIDLWGFGREKKITPPAKVDINKVLENVGYRKFKIKGNKIYKLSPNVKFDIGGAEAGYSIEEGAKLLISKGVKSALIDVGGDIRVVGTKLDGSPWKIAIQHPRKKNSYIMKVALKNAAISSSGDYEQFYMYRGKRYTHILDPRTGYPVSRIISVTVIAPSSVDADILSTSLFVMGYEKGIELLKKLKNIEALFILHDMGIKYTKGFKKYIL